jgi:hypothetical protein
MKPTRTQIFALMLALLLVFPGTAIGAVLGQPSLSANIVGGPIEPGEETALTVQLQNAGRVQQGSSSNPELNSRVTTARSVEVQLEKWDDAPLTIDTGTVFLGSISDGAMSSADFDVTVDEDAEPGSYTFKVEAEYDYTSYISENQGGQQQSSSIRSYFIDVRIEDNARFEIVDVRSDVLVGDRGTVSMTLQNVGGEAARDAAVTLTSPNGDVTLGGSTSASRYVGAWEPGANRTVTFDAAVAERASQQPYTLRAQVDYDDTDGVTRQSKSLSTQLLPGGERSFALSNAAGTLQVGREGSLSGTVTNTGPEPVYDAVVSVQSSASGVTFEEREYALGTLDPGQSADFELPVELSDSANPGERQFSYTVSYQNADDDPLTGKPLNARVEIQPKEPLFAVTGIETDVESGGSATVTVEVTNNADETLRNIDAKAFVDDPLSLSNDEGFIPELDAGETAELSFVVDSGSALVRTYALTVDFQYENSDFETKLSDTYSVGVDVVEPADGDGGGLPLPIIGGAALVVVALGGFVWYRRQ